MDIENCFLCELPSDLVISETQHFAVLAGLGPIVNGYCLLAAKTHTRSMADVPQDLRSERSQFLLTLRSSLIKLFGSCLVTEHGRMAVCSDDIEHDSHCFHAHFLLFPGAPDIIHTAATYFLNNRSFGEIDDALAYAATFDEYFLASSSKDEHFVFSGPLNMPRQLARILVAAKLGRLDTADWKVSPRREEAIQIAAELRSGLSL
jgi:diadenosine tetraphosphate (Ap4A) HIT family hydrolase